MYEAYEIIRTEDLPDVHSKGTLLRHKKTGAHVAILENDDENKVFDIAFRTPPEDSTGVAHIIEHTVLCGSDKFPLKDPFVELAKGSLNTFLNAMTYPDKTMYPVASCNDADLKNLMEVYLDAVFFPAIYKNENIFRQEGWHYHIENEDDPITYNGVVYNEMKGAFSTADSILERSVFSALFPDTAYGVESGGDPEFIPDLTYEQFLDFHRKYYHPSNSFIYLYGNMDMEERLDWIDREYLSRFDALEVDSRIEYQKAFEEPVFIEESYPVLDNEPLEDNTYLDMSVVVSDGSDVLTNTAFQVLEYVLLDMPGAPVKQALLDAGIGKDIDGDFSDGLLQPFFSIDAKYANPDDRDRFCEVIRDTLEKCVREGLDKKAILAAVYHFEFRFREEDYSVYPKGLIYGMSMYDSWIYDEDRPFDYLKIYSVFDELKKRADTGYFEELVKERLLDNPHCAVMVLKPEKGLAAKQEEKTAAKLEEYKASLSEGQIKALVEETTALREFQDAEETKEALATLPVLKRSDLDRKTHSVFRTQELKCGENTMLWHDFETNGISYLTLLFDIASVPEEYLPYASFLKSVLGYVNTAHYTYSGLSVEINGRTGGISCGLQNAEMKDGGERRFFGIRSKYLYTEKDFVFDIINEILFTSDTDDDKRLYEILSEQKSMLQVSLAQAGHMAAVQRAMAGISSADRFQELISGISYYRFLEDLFMNFEERKTEVKRVFKELAGMIFRPENLTVDITAQEEGVKGIEDNISALKEKLCTGETVKADNKFEKTASREAFKTSGQVQYVAEAGNFADKGYKYTGVLQLLRTMMNYDYLWMNIRVKGGAYGCMSGFKRCGDVYLVSYRDPHLENTLKIFKGLPEYLRSFTADEDTMTKYIIGTISALDTPRNPNAKGAISLNAYLSGVTEEMVQAEREEILNADDSSVRALSDMLEAAFDGQRICVVGSESAIDKHEGLFDSIEALVMA